MARSRSAGGVVWRHKNGRLEVLVVHRTKHDDWALPKGRLRRGERPVKGAVREVREETGWDVDVIGTLLTVTRRVPTGTRTTTYFEMRGVAKIAPLAALAEDVTCRRWMPLGSVSAVLASPADRFAVETFAATKDR